MCVCVCVCRVCVCVVCVGGWRDEERDRDTARETERPAPHSSRNGGAVPQCASGPWQETCTPGVHGILDVKVLYLKAVARDMYAWLIRQVCLHTYSLGNSVLICQ